MSEPTPLTKDGDNEERSGGIASDMSCQSAESSNIGGAVNDNTPDIPPLLNNPRSPAASSEPEDQQLLLIILSGILKNNPMRRMKKEFDKKVRKGRNRKRLNRIDNIEPSEDDFDQCRFFLDQIQNTNCVSQNPLSFTECSCLNSPNIEMDQAVEYLVQFAHLSKGIRETIVKEKIRHAIGKKGDERGLGVRFYSLPLGINKKVDCCFDSCLIAVVA